MYTQRDMHIRLENVGYTYVHIECLLCGALCLVRHTELYVGFDFPFLHFCSVVFTAAYLVYVADVCVQ